MTKQKIDLVVTRHPNLLAVLRERGIIDNATPVAAHVAVDDQPEKGIVGVKGKHVLGVLPHHLSSRCASITEIPMALTQADREAMQRGDLSLERTREAAGEPVTYYVTTERQWPVMRVFDRACREAVIQQVFHVHQIGLGTLELTPSEGEFRRVQLDLYRDRYRVQDTMSPYPHWGSWLDENGEQHRDQGPVRE